MELEQRIEELERELKSLKLDIAKTLVEIQANLPAQPRAAPRWQSKAWILALVNLLIAVVLFTNIYLYVPGSAPLNLSPTMLSWLHAFWLALAFVWLLLQLYPMALLFEEEDREWQGVVWRNLRGFARARAGLLVALTLVVLIVGIINSFVPALWLIVALALLLAVASIAARNMLDLLRKQAGA